MLDTGTCRPVWFKNNRSAKQISHTTYSTKEIVEAPNQTIKEISIPTIDLGQHRLCPLEFTFFGKS